MSSRFTTGIDVAGIKNDDGDLIARVRSPLKVDSRRGLIVTVPVGFVTDYASVPRPLWWLFPPALGRGASTVHDYLYRTGIVIRREADAIFYDLLRAEGVQQWRAWSMWAGVRAGGWKTWRRYRREDAEALPEAEAVEVEPSGDSEA